MAKVVSSPSAVSCAARRDHAGVVDQDIEPAVPAQDIPGQPAHLREAGQVRGHDLDLGERHAAGDLAPAASPRAASRATMITVAPSMASRSAVSLPIPLVAPVTRQVVPDIAPTRPPVLVT